jgi:hypothetical protein
MRAVDNLRFISTKAYVSLKVYIYSSVNPNKGKGASRLTLIEIVLSLSMSRSAIRALQRMIRQNKSRFAATISPVENDFATNQKTVI